MAQFYAQLIDEDRCRHSLVARAPIIITGLGPDGQVRAFSGTVQSVETGHTTFPRYPLRITITDSD
jgi:hypothetical protein